MHLNHSTTIDNYYLIWLNGVVSPQPYQGGHSDCPAGKLVTFAFKGNRRLSFMDVVIMLPENTPYQQGQYSTWEGDKEEEYYISCDIALKNCSVKLHHDCVVDIQDFDKFQWDFCPTWDKNFNAYSDKNTQSLQDFFRHLQGLSIDIAYTTE